MDLKDSVELQRFLRNRRVFHSFGAVKEKARSPYVLRWQRGCTSSQMQLLRHTYVDEFIHTFKS